MQEEDAEYVLDSQMWLVQVMRDQILDTFDSKDLSDLTLKKKQIYQDAEGQLGS